MEFEIREAEPRDFESINTLAVQAWQALKPGYDPEQWSGLIAAIGRTSGLAEKGILLVAVQDGQIYGSVGYMPPFASNPEIFPENWPSIRMLVTAPEAQGQGIGRRLTQACIDRAKADQAPYLGLHTSSIMTVALPLYLKMGFLKDKDLPPIAGAPYGRYALKLST